VPGLNPMFSLDTPDTYAFMKSFAGNDQTGQPFDDAMATLTEQMIDADVQADMAAGGTDSPGTQRVMSYLGSAAGLEYASRLEVRGNMDEQERKIRQFFGDIANIGMNAAPVNPATLASSYLIAAKLMDHGYPMAAQPDASANQWAQDNDVDPSKARFTDAGGHLLPPDQILADKDKLAAYDAWLEANGRGGSHDDAFGQKTVDLANSQQGAFTRTVDRYGPDS
jgi:hypothetical protein